MVSAGIAEASAGCPSAAALTAVVPVVPVATVVAVPSAVLDVLVRPVTIDGGAYIHEASAAEAAETEAATAALALAEW